MNKHNYEKIRLLGVQEVVGSIPAAPTICNQSKTELQNTVFGLHPETAPFAFAFSSFPHGQRLTVGRKWEDPGRVGNQLLGGIARSYRKWRQPRNPLEGRQ